MAGSRQPPPEPSTSPRRPGPEQAGQDEQHRPYQGKHRAPESKFPGLRRSLAKVLLDQPATAPHPSPDTPGSDSPEDPADQQAPNDEQVGNDEQAANGEQTADG
jgi:hypothetical protein